MSTTEGDAAQIARGRVCYRHPNRPAPLSCTRCGRPICLEDATDAPVGFLCPEDAKTPRRQQQAARMASNLDRPPVTMALLGIIVVAFIGQWIGLVPIRDYALFGPAVEFGQWYRIVTSGFLHLPSNIFHIGFNGYLLFMLGRMLENVVRSDRFLGIYLAGLFGGSAGALLLSYNSPTIGASGAVFGLMGAAMVALRSRGVNPWSSQIGTLVILNLVFTFVISNVSVGGHLGGLLAGAVAGWLVCRVERGHPQGNLVWVAVVVFAVIAVGIGVTGANLGITF